MGYVPANHQPPDLVGYMLFKTGATSEKTAVPLEHLNGYERRQLRGLLRKDVVHETASGRYWVDGEKLRERARARMKFTFAAIGFVIVLMIVAFLYAK
jgi:hypothetical protein